MSAGVFRYIDQHFHSPDNFYENNAALADNADIRERLFEGFRSEIRVLADGEPDPEEEPGEVSDLAELLDRAQDDDQEDVLDPVTEERNQRNIVIDDILLATFDKDFCVTTSYEARACGAEEPSFYNVTFESALRSVQPDLIETAEIPEADLLRDKGPIVFNMRNMYNAIYPQLAADALTAEIPTGEVPATYGIFAVADRETTINASWTLIRNGPSWRTLTLFGAIFALIGAIGVAERRPSTAIQFGGGMIGVGVVVIVVIFIIRALVPLLAGGGSSAGPVVATYASNIWPLVRIMIRLLIFGVVLATAGWIARLIWPDDWVYGHVSDDRGVRSTRRRRGEPQPVQQPVAAAVPVGYPGYPQQPYPGYPPGWGAPYPAQHYPPGPYGYPAGPYAQPAPPPQQYNPAGQTTAPVTPVAGIAATGPTSQPTAVVPDNLPPDAAQALPRIVATAPEADPAATAQVANAEGPENDEWAAESDW